MVDPLLTYAFAAAFFVVLIGSMLYLTFLTHDVEEDEADLGESVVGGAGAVERGDEPDAAELAAETDGEEVPREELDDEATEVDEADDEETDDEETDDEETDDEETDDEETDDEEADDESA